MNGARATVAIIPRERFSHSFNTLRSVLDNTKIDYDLIYVDGKTPGPVNEQIIEALQQANANIIKTDSFVSPNQARNLALKAANTEYIVFIDNDILVGPRWLEALVNCADETGATQVGPLQFIGDFKQQTIHIAGGYLHDRSENNQKVLYDEQKLFETKLKSLTGPLQRTPCDYIEYHCMLIRRDFLEEIGGLDEQLLSVHEHIDLGLELRRKKQIVYFEPKAIATYVPPSTVPWYDLPYFEIRWSEDWTLPSVDYFRKKWGYDRLGYAGEDDSSNLIDDTIVKFVRGHRGSVVGAQVSSDEIGISAVVTPAEIELIMTAFLTVECSKFTAHGQSDNQTAVYSMNRGTAEAFFQYLDSQPDQFLQSLDVCPMPGAYDNDPCLIRLPQLSHQDMQALQKHAFLILTTNEGSYECWFAVALAAGSSLAGVQEFAARMGIKLDMSTADRTISFNGADGQSHRLHQLNSGQILTENAFAMLNVGQFSTLACVLGPELIC